jgi:hypothetical protein
MKTIFANPTGGIAYHVRALGSHSERWAPFRTALAQSIAQWCSGQSGRLSSIILIGASGGYCLSSDWLKGFERIVVVEIDPLARMIFRARLPQHKIEFIKENILTAESLRPWREFLDSHAGIPILFCNILGQLPLMIPQFVARGSKESWGRERILDLVNAIGPSTAWASFHDRISRQCTKRIRDFFQTRIFEHREYVRYRGPPLENHRGLRPWNGCPGERNRRLCRQREDQRTQLFCLGPHLKTSAHRRMDRARLAGIHALLFGPQIRRSFCTVVLGWISENTKRAS